MATNANYYQIGRTLQSWVHQEETVGLPATLRGLQIDPLAVQMGIMDHTMPDRWGAFKRSDGAQKHSVAAQQLLRMVVESKHASMANDVLDGLDVIKAQHTSFATLAQSIDAMHTNTIEPYHFTMSYGYAMDCEPYFFSTRKEIVPHITRRIIGMPIEYVLAKQLEDNFVFPAPRKNDREIVPWDPYSIFNQAD